MHDPVSYDHPRFAKLPRPPYYAVIFSSQRTTDDEAGYAAASQRMVELVQQQPGYLGHESTRDATGFGITVAYFDSEASIAAWRDNLEHAAARREGHRAWYEHLELRIARVERAYGGVRRDTELASP
jgi:heme-degrading monooxygenase HmoA